MTREISPAHPTVPGLTSPAMIRPAAATGDDAVGLRLRTVTVVTPPAVGCITAGMASLAEALE